MGFVIIPHHSNESEIGTGSYCSQNMLIHAQQNKNYNQMPLKHFRIMGKITNGGNRANRKKYIYCRRKRKKHKFHLNETIKWKLGGFKVLTTPSQKEVGRTSHFVALRHFQPSYDKEHDRRGLHFEVLSENHFRCSLVYTPLDVAFRVVMPSAIIKDIVLENFRRRLDLKKTLTS